MMRGSSYLGSTPKRALSRPRRFGSLAAVFLIFAVLLSGFASLPLLDSLTKGSDGTSANNSTPLISDASALWCSDPKEGNLGLGMDNRSDWRSGSAWYPHAETSGRILTTQEAFSNGLKFTNFNGVGTSPGLPWFWISPPVGLPETDNDTEEGLNSVVSYTGNTPQGEGADNWYANMNSSRTPTKCVMGAVGASVANGILGITTGVTNLMGGIATFAFDPNFICEPNSGATNCIDLVGIIGGSGTSSGDGIIGKLTTSVYFPLLALAALLVGIYIIWNGLAKRQFRETFIGVIWSVLTVILGIGLLLNPLMLAKAPMVVGNALTSCIVGAFTGSGGCADASNGTGITDSSSTAYCEAWSSKNNFVDQAAITMTSMGCELWKSFVLQPYAQGSFGAPLDQLDTNRSDTIASKLIAKNPGFDSTTFCVDTKVKGTLESHYSNTLDLTKSGDSICNLAIYQAYLGVDAKMDSGAGGAPPAASAIDGRWLKVAQVAASDEGMYRSWAPSDFHLAQISMALIGLISAVLAAIVVFVVAAFALAFYVTSILMIAFAPFFLLAGVHPGKGRKMMIGWIGQVLSNIMKYAASAIFLVITVALYGAVLSNVSNPGAILIFMIILTVALLMYRREIVDMVGAIDLGGEKLSNKFAEKTMDRVRNTGKTAMAVGAGVTAGALSNGSLNPFSVANWNPDNIARNFGENIRAGADSGRRSLKSRPGMIGEVMKASDRISADNRADMAKQSHAVTDEAKKAALLKSKKETEYEAMNTELDESRETTEVQLADLQEKNELATSRQFGAQAQIDHFGVAQASALGTVDNAGFREYQDLLNQMKNLEMKAVISEEAGDLQSASAYRLEASNLEQRRDEVQSTISEADFFENQRQYDTALANGLDDPRVTPENVDSYGDHVRREYQGIMGTIAGTAVKAEQLRTAQEAKERSLTADIVSTRGELADATSAEARAAAASTEARQRVIDLKPGQVVTNRDVRKNASEIAAMQNDRSEDIRRLSSNVEDQMLSTSEAQTEATEVRDSWRSEAGVQRQGIADSQTAARRLTEVQNDVRGARQDAINSWRNAQPETAEDRARNAYANHIEAEERFNSASARTEELTAREAEGGLSELDRSNLFIARREEETARGRMESSERVIRTAGSDLGSMRDQLRSAVESEYAQRPSAQTMSMDNGLESFEQDLNAAATEVQSELRDRQAALQLAQQNEAAAGRQAQLAQREAQRLASTAQGLREQAASPRPVTPQSAERSTRAAERVTRAAESGRGLPRPQDAAPVETALPQEEVVAPTVVAPIQAPAPRVAPSTPQQAPAQSPAPVAQPREAAPQRVAPQSAPAPAPAERATPEPRQQAEPVREQPAARPVAQEAPRAQAPATPQAPRVAPQAAPQPVAQPAPQVVQPAPQAAPQAAPAPEPARPAPATPPAVAPAPVATPPEASAPQRSAARPAERAEAPAAEQPRRANRRAASSNEEDAPSLRSARSARRATPPVATPQTEPVQGSESTPTEGTRPGSATDNTPEADSGNPFRGGNPFRR